MDRLFDGSDAHEMCAWCAGTGQVLDGETCVFCDGVGVDPDHLADPGKMIGTRAKGAAEAETVVNEVDLASAPDMPIVAQPTPRFLLADDGGLSIDLDNEVIRLEPLDTRRLLLFLHVRADDVIDPVKRATDAL